MRVCVPLAMLKPMLSTFCFYGVFLLLSLCHDFVQMAENSLYRDPSP